MRRAAPLLALLAASAVPFAVGGLSGYGLGTTVVVAVVLALGYQVTYGFAGLLSIAHAPLMGVGAYTVARLMADRGWSFWTALPAGVLLAAAVGTVVGLPALRVRGDVLALVTLGAGEILQSLYLRSRLTGGYQGISGVPPVSVLGRGLGEAGVYVTAWALGCLVLAAVLALRSSPVGRAWCALRDDPVGAAAYGVRSGRLQLLAFAVGAGIAGAAGGLYAVQNGFVSSPSFGLAQTVVVILVVLVAGEGRIWRTVAAAAGFTVLFHRLAGYGAVSEGVTGALILAVVGLRLGLPGAVLGRLRASLTRWRGRRVMGPEPR